jgi:hypothetical protein
MPVVKTADGSQSQEAVNELIPQRSSRYGDAYSMGHGDLFGVVLEKPDLAASEPFILVDLSDTANFPHEETGKIRVYEIDINVERGEAAASGEFIVYIGVITEVDATNGSTSWFIVLHEETDDQATDGISRSHYHYEWREGFDLEIAADAPVWFLSNVGDSGDTDWQTDVNLDSPLGDAQSPSGAGDLCMLVEETGGTGSISICVTVAYLTEAT